MCAESSADMASSSSVSNGFTLGFFRIHSERFLTDRGVPCFKSQKVNLYYWAKRQKIPTDQARIQRGVLGVVTPPALDHQFSFSTNFLTIAKKEIFYIWTLCTLI